MNVTLSSLLKSGHLRRVDAALGEWMARAFPDTPSETILAAALAARAIADGHSTLALDQAQPWLAGLAEGKPPALPTPRAWREILQDSAAVHVCDEATTAANTPLVLDKQGRLYLHRYFEYERQLAEALIARARTQTPESRVPSPESRRSDLDPEQQGAITTALAHRFTLITGGPGTGKTHSVVRMLVALAHQAQGKDLRIALAAPTGKAAARLGEALRMQLGKLDLPDAISVQIPRDAQTLHSLLGISPWRTRPKFDHATPLPYDVVVVDEVSMVDLPLMARLVDAVPASARLILLGDPGQLAAVEAGNVLGALVEAAGDDGSLHDCHVALTRSHRFNTDSSLGALAASIARGDVEAALTALDRDDDVSMTADSRMPQLVDASAQAYRAILGANDPTAALQAARGFRVLTALRHGASGCLALDRAIAQRLQRMAGVRHDEHWWRGRLIMITGNRPELGLFNGDTGVVWPDSDGALQAWFEGSDGTPRALSVAALPPHEGAFALTVHKAQGSEFDRVTLVTGPTSPVLTRELLYTGITRARTRVTLCTTLDILRAGIERRTLRFTGLADRLREAGQDSAVHDFPNVM